MDAQLYLPHQYGKLVWDRLGAWDYPYFLPTPIPREVPLAGRTLDLVLLAEHELGLLAGTASTAEDFELLSRSHRLVEALSSSTIEGTQSTLDEVMANEIAVDLVSDLDLREVLNHELAADWAREALNELPISQRVVLGIQSRLLANVRGAERNPGEIRRSPVWVGGGASPAEAKFIPPIPHELPALLTDWEQYVNSKPTSIVLWLALSHYQFETIHPLLDGNGRVGRILIETQLIASGTLPRQVLGISNYLSANRSDYYANLQLVRERGEMTAWIEFFAKGVLVSAQKARALLAALIEIRYRLMGLLGDRQLVDFLIKNPLPSVGQLTAELGISQPTAAKYLKHTTELGITESRGKSGRGNKERWVVTEVWNRIQGLQSAAE